MIPDEPTGPSEDPTPQTRPISREQPTRARQNPVPAKSSLGATCRAGHDQPNNPTWHRTLGLVPAMTSVVFGGIVVLIVLGLELWLLPWLFGWTIAALFFGLLVSAVTQLALGHRGRCWLWRTLRWWTGPIGSLVDPFGMG